MTTQKSQMLNIKRGNTQSNISNICVDYNSKTKLKIAYIVFTVTLNHINSNEIIPFQLRTEMFAAYN